MTKSKTTVRVELSKSDLSEAVAEWAKRKGLIQDGDDPHVDAEVHEECTGYGMAERYVHTATVVLTVSK